MSSDKKESNSNGPNVTYLQSYGCGSGSLYSTLTFIPLKTPVKSPQDSMDIDLIEQHLLKEGFTWTHSVIVDADSKWMGQKNRFVQKEMRWYQDDRDENHGFLTYQKGIFEGIKTGPQRTAHFLGISSLRIMANSNYCKDNDKSQSLILLDIEHDENGGLIAGRYMRQ